MLSGPSDSISVDRACAEWTPETVLQAALITWLLEVAEFEKVT